MSSGPISAVYSIRNQQTSRVYVGSSKDVQRRWKFHRHFLMSGHHHNQWLQSDWNEFGSDSFIFEVLDPVPESKLRELEEQRINQFRDRLYNAFPESRRGTRTEQLPRISITPKLDQWLTVHDVVKLIAVNEETVRRWVRSGELPVLNVGGKRGAYRFRRDEFQRFIDGRYGVKASGAGKDGGE